MKVMTPIRTRIASAFWRLPRIRTYPKTYVVGGFFSDEIVWRKVKRSWDWKMNEWGCRAFTLRT